MSLVPFEASSKLPEDARGTSNIIEFTTIESLFHLTGPVTLTVLSTDGAIASQRSAVYSISRPVDAAATVTPPPPPSPSPTDTLIHSTSAEGPDTYPTSSRFDRRPRGPTGEAVIGLSVALGLVLLIALAFIVLRSKLVANFRIGRKTESHLVPFTRMQECGNLPHLDFSRRPSPTARSKPRTYLFDERPRSVGSAQGIRTEARNFHENHHNSMASLPSYRSQA
ncbi:hypothetical protein AB1N83_005954 [Pleurotus pulmonarius]